MLVKLVGALVIFISCTYFGIRRSAELKGRCTSLKNISAALMQLETEIAFSSNDLKRAFLNIDKSTKTYGLFRDAAERIGQYGIKKAWTYAVLKSPMPLSDSDRELLLMLSVKLGMTDAKNQLRHTAYINELVNAQAAAAEGEYRRLGRLYQSGGVLAGLFIVLVIV